MKTSNNIIVIFTIFFFSSCDDIIEKDITNDSIIVNYPTNGAIIESNVATFQWSHLEGAEKYRVQVYKPNQINVFDTLVNSNTVTLPLNEGDYQWRVRGENSAYYSNYSFAASFQINQSIDLTNQQVILNNPSDNLVTNNSNLTLSWNSLNSADYYKIELINISSGNNLIYQQNNIFTNNITLNNSIINQDGEYIWKVKGVNNSSETSYTSRNFKVDTVIPNQPQNVTPSNNSLQTINQNITFSWTIPPDSGIIQSNIKFQIEFSNSNTFNSIIQSTQIQNNNMQQSFNTVGDYYWRVKAIDLAGNSSIYSNIYKFTIN